MIGIAASIVLVAGAIWCVAPAAADVTQQDNNVKVTLVGGVTDSDGNVLSGSRATAFEIQVLTPATTVQCHMNFDADATCGTQATTGCPTYQCWSYTAALSTDGFAELTVDYDDGFLPSYLTFQFSAVSTPPDTTLAGPGENSSFNRPQSFERPLFDIEPKSAAPSSVQCTLSAPAAPAGPWRSCNIPRLRLFGVYELRARAIDIFGRSDPTPAQTIFSPTPCRPRVLGHVRSLNDIVKHGLRLSVACIQVARFEIDVDLRQSLVSRFHLSSSNLGFVKGHSSKPLQTQVLTLHTLRGLPRLLFNLPTLALGVRTFALELYGAGDLTVLTVRG
jgi:hypothetical protein